MSSIINLPMGQGSSLGGKFWFSQRQKDELRDTTAGLHDKTFCIINSVIMEYTELIEFEDFLEDPTRHCEYDDAIYLGEGFFHHFDEY